MKKLLNVLTTTFLTSCLPLSVVSCTNSINFKELKNAINNKESFVILFKNQDDEKIKKLIRAKENESSYFDSKMEEIKYEHQRILKNGTEKKDDSILKFWSEIKGKINFKVVETSLKEINYKNDKKAKKFIDFIIDQITPIIQKQIITINDILKEEKAKKIAKEMVQKYFKEFKQLPLLLLIRNGQIIDWQTGYSTEEKEDKKIIDEITSKWKKSFTNDQQEIVILEKIKENKKEDEPKDNAKNFLYTLSDFNFTNLM